MQCPVRDARGDQGAKNTPSVKGATGIKVGRKDFLGRGLCLWAQRLCVCACPHGRAENDFSVLSWSRLSVFGVDCLLLNDGISCVTASRGSVKLLRSP